MILLEYFVDSSLFIFFYQKSKMDVLFDIFKPKTYTYYTIT